MPQIAQQDYLRLRITHALSSLTADEKKWLLDKCKAGTIFDVIIEFDVEDDGLYQLRIVGAVESINGVYSIAVYDTFNDEIATLVLTVE